MTNISAIISILKATVGIYHFCKIKAEWYKIDRMVKIILKFLNKKIEIVFPVLILLITATIALLNYSPGTWLSGWDTLHPEFNFPLNFNRIINGVWRQEQGLGALAGHAHMSELPRIIFLWLFSFIFRLWFLRYLYFFTTLCLGPLGVYFFLKKIIFPDKDGKTSFFYSFLGSMFYLMNLGTVQHFFVPFEMFAAQFAFLPWLFLYAVNYLKERNKKNLFLFVVISILASPMAYASVLWYVYFIFLTIFLFFYFLLQERTRIGFNPPSRNSPFIKSFDKRCFPLRLDFSSIRNSMLNHRVFDFGSFNKIIVLLVLSLVVNAYWLLPNIYFMATGAKSVPLSKTNLLFSQKAFSFDTKYATLGNAAILKGFLFDWNKYNFQNDRFDPLLETWSNYLGSPPILFIGYLFFMVIILGIADSLFVKKNRVVIAVFLGFIFAYIFLLHGMPFLSTIFAHLRDRLDIFKEGLRFPWTKFSISVMFCYSVFFSLGVQRISFWFKKSKFFRFLTFPAFFILLVIWILPMFWGNLISRNMRVKIPDDYFKTFQFFNTKPKNERIGVFPSPAIWGWEYYDWGFEGAGFIWFGLPQAVLVRDFDRWNPGNEKYYWEASYAIYSQNLNLLQSVLDKYRVNYLIIDQSIINPSWPKSVYFENLEEMISSSTRFLRIGEFGKIKIYSFKLNSPANNFITLKNNLPVIEPDYKWNNLDMGYSENEDFVSSAGIASNASAGLAVYYPFRNLFTGREQSDLEFKVEQTPDFFIFKKVIPQRYSAGKLIIPLLNDEEITQIDELNLSLAVKKIPEVFLDGNKIDFTDKGKEIILNKESDFLLEIKIPKIQGLQSFDSADGAILLAKPELCDYVNLGKFSYEINKDVFGNEIKISSTDAKTCLKFDFPQFSNRIGYLISVDAENIKGNPFLFWVENLNINRADLETSLPEIKGVIRSYFIQPPMRQYDIGYSFHLDNYSIGNEEAVNVLKRMTINPFPYRFLTGMKVVKTGAVNHESGIMNHESGISVDHPNSSYYKVQIKNPVAKYLILSQSYDNGWIALVQSSKFKVQSLPHVLVNNWENGWELSSKVKVITAAGGIPSEGGTSSQSDEESLVVYIVYWPQILEYLGFFFLLGGVIFVLHRRT